MKTCNVCSKENPDDANYCKYCGERILQVCDKCGKENLDEATFCQNCGTRLNEGNSINFPRRGLDHISSKAAKRKLILLNPIIYAGLLVLVGAIFILLLSFLSGRERTTPALSFLQSKTYTATITPTMTRTPTPTATLMNTTKSVNEIDIEVKNYPVNQCMKKEVPSSMSGLPISFEFTECVDSISILASGEMRVNFTWMFIKTDDGLLSDGECITKFSDYQNTNMYMSDDLGNRYDHSSVGTDIGIAILCGDDDKGTFSDYFIFPPINPDAKFLKFHDDDNLIETDFFEFNDESSTSQLLNDDFSSDLGWINEADFLLNKQDQRVEWHVTRDETSRFYLPVSIESGNVDLTFDYKISAAGGNCDVVFGLVEDLEGSFENNSFPTGFFLILAHDTCGMDFAYPLITYHSEELQHPPSCDSWCCVDPSTWVDAKSIDVWRTIHLAINEGIWRVEIYEKDGKLLDEITGTMNTSHDQYNNLMLFREKTGGWEWAEGYLDNIVLAGVEK